MKAGEGQAGQVSVVSSIFSALLIAVTSSVLVSQLECRCTLLALNCSTALKDVYCLVHVTLSSS